MRAAKLGILGLVVAACSAFFVSTAQAAPTKLPTAFNQNQHVYVMPDTKISNPPDLDQRLVAEALQENLAVYVVYTVEGDEALANNFADQCLQKVLQTWSVQQGFPADNYLIIVCVQDKLHPNVWDYAGAAGTAPTKIGLTKSELTSQLDRNKSAIGADPAGFAIYSVKDIVGRIGDLKAGGGGNPGTPTTPADNKTWLIVGGIILVLVVGGVIIFIFTRRS